MKQIWITLLLIVVSVMTTSPCLADVVCNEENWIVAEITKDVWQLDTGYTQSGVAMGFWEQPTFCTETVTEGNIKYKRTKSLVCLPPGYTLIEAAEGTAQCTIEGEAIAETGIHAWPSDDPCVHGWYMAGGGFVSNYGDVIIANRTVKYVCDQCPDDPDKTEPGQCGCGKPDTDSDGDGVPDCVDGNNNGPPEDCPTK